VLSPTLGPTAGKALSRPRSLTRWHPHERPPSSSTRASRVAPRRLALCGGRGGLPRLRPAQRSCSGPSRMPGGPFLDPRATFPPPIFCSRLTSVPAQGNLSFARDDGIAFSCPNAQGLASGLTRPAPYRRPEPHLARAGPAWLSEETDSWGSWPKPPKICTNSRVLCPQPPRQRLPAGDKPYVDWQLQRLGRMSHGTRAAMLTRVPCAVTGRKASPE